MKTSSVLRMGLLTILLLTVVDWISAAVFPVLPMTGVMSFSWRMLPDVIAGVVLTFAARRAPWRGWQLAVALAAVPFIVQVINAFEGVCFLKIDGVLLYSLLFSPVKYILMAVLWRMFYEQRADAGSFAEPALRSWSGKIGRFLLCDGLYIILYLVAGVLIYPFVRTFYATQTLPGMGTIIASQLLVRGPLFCVVILILVRLMGAVKWTDFFWVGLVFAMISGVVPLVSPNPLLPDHVRWVHLGEVTSSNFIFGLIAAALWSQTRSKTERPE